MEFFFADDVERMEPAQTRLLDLRAEPYPDGKRLRLGLELTPFKQRPNIEIALKDSRGETAASASIVEPAGWKLELTLHIRAPDPGGSYRLEASLGYADLGEVDRREVAVAVTPQDSTHG
jgi:hypothetical protein